MKKVFVFLIALISLPAFAEHFDSNAVGSWKTASADRSTDDLGSEQSNSLLLKISKKQICSAQSEEIFNGNVVYSRFVHCELEKNYLIVSEIDSSGLVIIAKGEVSISDKKNELILTDWISDYGHEKKVQYRFLRR